MTLEEKYKKFYKTILKEAMQILDAKCSKYPMQTRETIANFLYIQGEANWNMLKKKEKHIKALKLCLFKASVLLETCAELAKGKGLIK